MPRGEGARWAYFLDLCPSSSVEIRVVICYGAFLKQSANFKKLQGFIGEGDSSTKAPTCVSGVLIVIKNNLIGSLLYSTLHFSVHYSLFTQFSKGKAVHSAPTGSVVER